MIEYFYRQFLYKACNHFDIARKAFVWNVPGNLIWLGGEINLLLGEVYLSIALDLKKED